jgi:hypothetical protein
MTPLGILIVEKTGVVKSMQIKDYKEDELYKKCGFKVSNGFSKQTQWKIKMNGKCYMISVYGKTNGKANTENKYDFPPPIDSTLFFGACALVGNEVQKDNSLLLISLNVELWEKCYEKLFGGFEDLALTCLEDENEIDELKYVPKEKKTKSGYLKDGFVVDSDTNDDDNVDDENYNDNDDEDNDDEDNDDDDDILNSNNKYNTKDDDEEELIIGSELSEEDYIYSDDEEDKNKN